MQPSPDYVHNTYLPYSAVDFQSPVGAVYPFRLQSQSPGYHPLTPPLPPSAMMINSPAFIPFASAHVSNPAPVASPPTPTGGGGASSSVMKDSRWLTLEVCREYQRNKCSRDEGECKFAHPPPHVEVQNGRVVCCYDSIKGKCQRKDPPCKYLHPPQHLREQLLQNGRNNLILKNIQMQILQQQLIAQASVVPMGTPYLNPAATAPSPVPTPSPYSLFAPGPIAVEAAGPPPGLLATAASPPGHAHGANGIVHPPYSPLATNGLCSSNAVTTPAHIAKGMPLSAPVPGGNSGGVTGHTVSPYTKRAALTDTKTGLPAMYPAAALTLAALYQGHPGAPPPHLTAIPFSPTAGMGQHAFLTPAHAAAYHIEIPQFSFH